MKETYYVVQDKNSEAFYCILPNRSIVSWSIDLSEAFFFSTEAEAEKFMFGRITGDSDLTVLTVNMVIEDTK